MARNCNENDEDNIDPASIVSNLKSTLKPDLIKELLHNSFQDNKTKLGNDALTMVVEIAKCLVTETCLRASTHALRENRDKVDIEHIEKCLPQLISIAIQWGKGNANAEHLRCKFASGRVYFALSKAPGSNDQ